mgnify:CR=1 FL=1
MKLKEIKEKRFFISDKNIRSVEVSGSRERYIEGYAALFNHESRLLYEFKDNKLIEFVEVLDVGCFDKVLADPNLNCIHTINHDRNQMVARTLSGTLKLSVDEHGLIYRVSIPNTTTGNDLYEMVKRGDLFESSFIFTVSDDGEQWIKEGNINKRLITSISGLYDTSTVTDGAYSNTIVTISRNLSNIINVESEKNDVEVEDDKSNTDIDSLNLDILIAEHE